MRKEITIVIADDHPIVRQGFRQIIERKKHLKILAESSDGQEALDSIREFKPDVAILDIDMPEMSGFDVAQTVKEKKLSVEMVFLTIHNSEKLFNTAVDLGVKGYLLKDSALAEITKCIETVADSNYFVSSSLSNYLISRNNTSKELLEKKPTLKDLTPSELRILKLIAEHKKTKEIAKELFISVRTVDTHRRNICQKLNLKGTNSLLKFAISNKSQIF